MLNSDDTVSELKDLSSDEGIEIFSFLALPKQSTIEREVSKVSETDSLLVVIQSELFINNLVPA